MAMNALVGSLRVVLGMDSAAFQSGVRQAETRLTRFQGNVSRIGAGIQRAGATLSAAVSLPLAGLFAATQSATAGMIELRNQANLAGVSAQELAVLSLATREVGVEQDQLADILKDVNERIGEYMNTGGGEMADFFENIAPQVGVTADMFRDLSSADALQLYVSSLEKANLSQAEMTFYMEALASDASRLVPVFQENGRVLAEVRDEAERLGLTIDDDLIESAAEASRRFGITSGVLKTQFQSALVALAPVIQRMVEMALPYIEQLVGKVSELSDWFINLPPEAQEMAAKLWAVGLAAGPGAIAVGLLVSALRPIAAVVAAILSPVGLAVLGIGALTFVVWRNWDAIKAWVSGALEAVGDFVAGIPDAFANAVQWVREAMDRIWSAITAKIQGWISAIGDLGRSVTDALFGGMRGNVTNHAQAYADEVSGQVTSALEGRLTAPPTAGEISDLGDYLDSVTGGDGAEEIGGGAADDVIAGVVSGVEAGLPSVAAAGADIGLALRDGAQDALGIRSPSRVFADIGQWALAGLGVGVAAGSAALDAATASAMGAFADTAIGTVGDIAATAGGEVANLTGEVEALGAISAETFSDMGRWLVDLSQGATTLSETLGTTLNQWSAQIGASGIDTLTGVATSAGGDVWGGLLGGIAGSLLGFANGGEFEVGGVGGTDSQIVAFRASPDERVSITTPAQQKAASQSGGGMVEVVARVEDGNIVQTIEAVSGSVYARLEPATVTKAVGAVDRSLRATKGYGGQR